MVTRLYVDRSKATGRMITIDPSNAQWEDHLEQQLQQRNSEATD
ncbi:hypothetical protein PN462_09405 [Spirulina sp. CS-785/01]|nr:hypothetical protein [Spirulina sp. CS-785/01]MDB9313314.1 hypothetical protein [Spirulina sp. CS-785/01]